MGGHLAQLEVLARAVAGRDRFLVTVPSPHAEFVFPGVRRYTVRRVLRNPANFLVNFLQSLRILLRERPDAVVTTGAGDALPTVLLSLLFGSTIVFMESLARVRRPSLFGRLVHRWCDLVMIQWPELRWAYPEAVAVSPVFPLVGPRHDLPASPSILILTGTHTLGFERLLRAVDSHVEADRIPGRVFAQIGHSTYVPRHMRHVRFLPHADLLRKLSGADLVVTHDGSASIGESLAAGKPTVVVPRTKEGAEVSYGSGQELALHLSRLGLVELVRDPDRLPKAIAALRGRRSRDVSLDLPDPVATVRRFLDRVEPEAAYVEGSRHSRISGLASLRPVIVSPVSPWEPRASGIRSYVEQLSSGLAEAGIPVVVATSGVSPNRHDKNVQPLILSRVPPSSLRFLAILAIRGRRLARRGNILHFQRLDHLLPLVLWTRSTRVIVTLHGFASRSVAMRKGQGQARLYRVMEAVASCFVDTLIAVDQQTKIRYESAFPRLRGTIAVIPVGVAPPKASAGGEHPLLPDIPQGAKVVLYAGRFEPEKNLPLLLDGFARLRDRIPNASLLLVGSGRDEPRLRACIQALGMEHVSIVPTLPRAILWKLLRRADVVAIPSRFESGPLVALEAIAVGTPVVSTRVGRVPEIMIKWVVGELSPPDPQAFGAALSRVLETGKSYYRDACMSASTALSFASTLTDTIQVYGSRTSMGGS